MRDIVKEIIRESNDFLFGPRNSVKHTLDATQILNDYITRHRLSLAGFDWTVTHAELLNELVKFKAGNDIQVVPGARVPQNLEPSFHELPYYDGSFLYYERKTLRTMDALNYIIFMIAVAGICYAFAVMYQNVISSGYVLGH